MRLNLPARKISAEQGGWQRVLCVLCTSIRRVKGFFFFFVILRNRRWESIDMFDITTRVRELISAVRSRLKEI